MLKLENISKAYNIGGTKRDILKHVNLTVEKGKIIALTGKSGSGKTTLLNIVSGLAKPDSGKVYLNKKKITYFLDIVPSRLRNRQMGFIFQTFRLLPDETVLENVLLPARIKGNISSETHQKALELLEKLEIKDHAHMKACYLSGGQKQRAAIARALINNPELLLADEPTANLDAKTSTEIGKILQKLAKEGLAILLVTHHRDLLKHADKTFVLANGKLEAEE